MPTRLLVAEGRLSPRCAIYDVATRTLLGDPIVHESGRT